MDFVSPASNLVQRSKFRDVAAFASKIPYLFHGLLWDKRGFNADVIDAAISALLSGLYLPASAIDCCGAPRAPTEGRAPVLPDQRLIAGLGSMGGSCETKATR